MINVNYTRANNLTVLFAEVCGSCTQKIRFFLRIVREEMLEETESLRTKILHIA